MTNENYHLYFWGNPLFFCEQFLHKYRHQEPRKMNPIRDIKILRAVRVIQLFRRLPVRRVLPHRHTRGLCFRKKGTECYPVKDTRL
mgnify:CR=1 FL=1